MRALKIYWGLFQSFGNTMKGGRQLDQLYRNFVTHAFADIGFFDYLSQPRTFGEIMAHFDFEDGDFAQEVLDILIHDKKNLIQAVEDRYVRNSAIELPVLADILGSTDPRLHYLGSMGEAMYDSVLERLRKERVGVKQVFERNQKKVVSMFNEMLGGGMYTILRRLCFEYLPAADRKMLQGGQLLEIGCGNGLETAEIWMTMDGNVKITAIDTVPSMLELAQDQFEKLLTGIDPDHPALTDDNRPVFKEANAVSLPFPDNSFDAAFFLLMLHWTSDPETAIKEAARVVKPGGFIFGAQPGKPQVNPYLNLVIRSSRDSYGFFWKEDFLHWLEDAGLEVEMASPANVFIARKPSMIPTVGLLS